MINWVASTPFDESASSDPAHALEWLDKRNPSLDASGVLRAVADACPGFPERRW